MSPRTFVIAEAGVNHNGSLDLALELVSAAKATGADAIKFQTFSADRLVTRTAAKADYQRASASGDESQYEMLKSLELSSDAFRRIRAHCTATGLTFMSSPFDEEAADLLDALGVEIFKIPSGEITNLPFLRHVATKGKPVILSTGMCWLGEVEVAVRTLTEAGVQELTLLHCVTEYPAPFEQINLRAMQTLGQAFGLPVGYSDHTQGIEASIAAVALGARVIEKHFTLDTTLPGPDHRASLAPPEFKQLVDCIRNVEMALGDGRKRPAPCEVPNIAVARKSVVAVRPLPAGTRLTAADLAIKRPGHGIPPASRDAIVGRLVARPVEADQPIRWQDLA